MVMCAILDAFRPQYGLVLWKRERWDDMCVFRFHGQRGTRTFAPFNGWQHSQARVVSQPADGALSLA
jgi:hypothetical protein